MPSPSDMAKAFTCGTPQAMGTEETTAQVHPAKLTAAFVTGAERLAGSKVRIGTVAGVRLGGSQGQQHVEGGPAAVIFRCT